MSKTKASLVEMPKAPPLACCQARLLSRSLSLAMVWMSASIFEETWVMPLQTRSRILVLVLLPVKRSGVVDVE